MRVSTRKAERPRWQWGNFHVVANPALNFSDGQPYINVVSVLTPWSGIAPDESAIGGFAAQRAVRFIDVGGLVFDAGMANDNGTFDDRSDINGSLDWFTMGILCTDTVHSDGQPNCIDYDWGRTTQPVSIASQQIVSAERRDAPTRVLWRWAEYFNNDTITATDAGTTLFQRSQLEVQRARRYRSLKLKVRLSSEDVLTYHHFIRRSDTSTTANIIRGCKSWFTGSFYYRYVM